MRRSRGSTPVEHCQPRGAVSSVSFPRRHRSFALSTSRSPEPVRGHAGPDIAPEDLGISPFVPSITPDRPGERTVPECERNGARVRFADRLFSFQRNGSTDQRHCVSSARRKRENPCSRPRVLDDCPPSSGPGPSIPSPTNVRAL